MDQYRGCHQDEPWPFRYLHGPMRVRRSMFFHLPSDQHQVLLSHIVAIQPRLLLHP